MRLLVFLILFLVRATAWAIDVRTTDDFARPSLFSLADFQDRFQSEGFWSVDAQNTGAAGVLTVDQIYVDFKLEQTIYLKLGLQQFPTHSFNRVADGFAYQGETFGGTPYVLFFDNIPVEQAKILIAKVSTKTASARIDKTPAQLALRLLIPHAYAAPGCSQSPVIQQSKLVTSTMDSVLGFQALATCALTALKSASQAVTDPFESLKKLVQDPAKFWSDTKKEWQNLKHFVVNMRSELSKFFSTLQDLDASIVEQIACMIVGQVVGTVGLGLLTGGAAVGIAKISGMIASAISKIGRLKSLLQALSRLHRLGKTSAFENATKQVLSCAVH